jgi:hypothetical protein
MYKIGRRRRLEWDKLGKLIGEFELKCGRDESETNYSC